MKKGKRWWTAVAYQSQAGGKKTILVDDIGESAYEAAEKLALKARGALSKGPPSKGKGPPDNPPSGPVPGTPNTPPEKGFDAALSKLAMMVVESQLGEAATAAMRRMERGRRFAVGLEELGKYTGEEAHRVFLRKMGGKLPAVGIQTRMTKAEKDILFETIRRKSIPNAAGIADVLSGRYLRATGALEKVIGLGAPLTRSEIEVLEDYFGASLWKKVMESQPQAQRIARILWDLYNVPRALKSSSDLSWFLRQGVLLTGNEEWWKSIGPSLRTFWGEGPAGLTRGKTSKTLEREGLDAIESNPLFQLGRESGLYIARPGGVVEDEFTAEILDKLFIYGNSQSAFRFTDNNVRWNIFYRLANEHIMSGVNPDKDMKPF